MGRPQVPATDFESSDLVASVAGCNFTRLSCSVSSTCFDARCDNSALLAVSWFCKAVISFALVSISTSAVFKLPTTELHQPELPLTLLTPQSLVRAIRSFPLSLQISFTVDPKETPHPPHTSDSLSRSSPNVLRAAVAYSRPPSHTSAHDV